MPSVRAERLKSKPKRKKGEFHFAVLVSDDLAELVYMGTVAADMKGSWPEAFVDAFLEAQRVFHEASESKTVLDCLFQMRRLR